jgi:NAD(P)-dependent dehydrogenase (short-subunit alcohol dehydrogenase family)
VAAGELAGKVAIVTGGASGIGRATVEAFVAEGARVVIADINAEEGEALAGGLGDAAAFTHADVGDPDRIQAMIDFTLERFGGLDVLFNNAGIGGRLTRFLDDDLDDFSRVMDVNLRSTMVASQRAARYMKDHGGGSIINNSSVAGISAGQGVMTYRAAKAAVIHFSRSIAVELAQHGIRVNCVAPAHIATAITHYDVDPIVRFMQPLQRVGRPEDVANAVVYLASDRAAQITGVVLPVDGGTTAGPPPSQIKLIMSAGANTDDS